MFGISLTINLMNRYFKEHVNEAFRLTYMRKSSFCDRNTEINIILKARHVSNLIIMQETSFMQPLMVKHIPSRRW